MSDFRWQQEQEEYEAYLAELEQDLAEIREDHPDMEELLCRLEYLEDR